MAEPRAALELTSVSRGYEEGPRRVQVLLEANLAIKPGEMVGLVAPSGAGKSTLLHIAGLLERPDSGEVLIDGKAASSISDRERTSLRRSFIGFVYQFHHLLPELNARENVMMPQMVQGLSKREAENRAQELLEYLKIGERATHRPTELSGGEQQRVAIARAVANGPRILLADEPTGNLDPKTSEHVFGAVEALVRGSGLAALIATHNHDLAARMDRRITIIDQAIEPFD